jgi:prophage antirepressor-like protein
VELDGEPWFVSTDVCRALAMDLSRGAYQWLRGVGDDEKRLTTYGEIDPQITRGATGRGGFRPGTQVTLISESGLYKLIMRSDKPDAKKFQNWVTKVVLPAIRKDGGYILGEEKVSSRELLLTDEINEARVLGTDSDEGDRASI